MDREGWIMVACVAIAWALVIILSLETPEVACVNKMLDLPLSRLAELSDFCN